MGNLKSYFLCFFILAGLLIILVLPLCSASLGVYKQNDCVDIKTILNTGAVTISTINYPNSSVAVSNKTMTKTGMTFNYTFCNTSMLGNYVYDYFDAEGNVYVNDFEITQTGTSLSVSQGIVYIIFLLGGFIFLGLALYGGLAIPYKNPRDNEGVIMGVNKLKYVKIFLLAIAYLLIIFLLGVLRSIMANFLMFDNASLFFEWMFWIAIYLLFPIFVCSLIFILMAFLADKKLRKKLFRGVRVK